MIGLEELKTISILYEKKSLKEAAKELKLKEASVKKAVESIEGSINVNLLQIKDDEVLFTRSGSKFAEDASFAIKYINRAIINAQMLDAEDQMALRIASSLLSPSKYLIDAIKEKKAVLDPLKCQQVHIFNIEESLRHLESHVDIIASFYDERLLKKYSLDAIEVKREKILVALSPSNELSSIPMLDIEDLYGKKLYIYKKGYLRSFDQLRSDIKEYHKEIEVVSFDSQTDDIEKRIEESGAFLATFPSCKENLTTLSLKPVLWNYSSLFGILSKKDANDKVKKVIEELKRK